MKKIKLLFILGTFFPAQAGGPDSSIYWLNKAFLNLRHKCECLVLSFFYSLNQKDIKKYKIVPNKICKINGVKVIFLKFTFFRILSLSFYKFLFFNLKKYDIVHLNSFFFPITFISAFFLNFFNMKYCISLRGELEEHAFKNNFLKKKLFLNIFKHIYKKAIFFHYTTTNEKVKSEKILGKKFNYEIFPNYITKETSKMQKNKKRDRYLYLGRLHPKKNIETIISAYKKFIEKSKSAKKLYLVGTGEEIYVNKLKNYVDKLSVNKKIIFIGKKDYISKFDILNRSKFLIFFSKTENFGNVILESLVCKTPVIVSNNLPWVDIKKFRTGYFIKNNVNTLTKFLIKAENLSSKDYIKIQKNCKILINRFYIEKKIKYIFKIYNKYI